MLSRRRQWHPTPALFPGKSHGLGGAWRAAVHGAAKSRTWLSDFTFTFHFHALEKEMTTHSSVLAWRIPGTAESGGLLSVGLHRVGHDWSDLEAAADAEQGIIFLWASVFSSAKWGYLKNLVHRIRGISRWVVAKSLQRAQCLKHGQHDYIFRT